MTFTLSSQLQPQFSTFPLKGSEHIQLNIFWSSLDYCPDWNNVRSFSLLFDKFFAVALCAKHMRSLEMFSTTTTLEPWIDYLKQLDCVKHSVQKGDVQEWFDREHTN